MATVTGERDMENCALAVKYFIFVYSSYAKANVLTYFQENGNMQSSCMLGRKKTIIKVVFLKSAPLIPLEIKNKIVQLFVITFEVIDKL